MNVNDEQAITEFEDFLQDDLSARKFELNQTFSVLDKDWATGKNSDLALKMLMTLVYSHWEGHSTAMMRRYLETLVTLKTKVSDLPDLLKIYYFQKKGHFDKLSANKVDSKGLQKVQSLASLFSALSSENEMFDIVFLNDNAIFSQNLSFDDWSKWMHVMGIPEAISTSMIRKKNLLASILNIRRPAAHGDLDGFQPVSGTLSYSMLVERRDFILEVLKETDEVIVKSLQTRIVND